jgi:hypothetical protein
MRDGGVDAWPDGRDPWDRSDEWHVAGSGTGS